MQANSFWSAPVGGISQCGFRDADELFMNKLGVGGGVRQLGGLTLQAAGWRPAASGRYRAEQALGNATVYQTHVRSDGAKLLLERGASIEAADKVSGWAGGWWRAGGARELAVCARVAVL